MYGTTDAAQRLVTALVPITQALQALTHSLTQAGGGPGAPAKAPSQVSPLQGAVVQQAPYQFSPVQFSPVQQSPVQSGPPMKSAPQKVTQGGGPSVQYVPARETPKQFVLIPRPRPDQHDQPRKRHRNRGGGGAQSGSPTPPTSRIQAQQNRGGAIVNRESRNMPANYRDNVTSDRGRNGRTSKTSDPGGAKRGQVSAQHNTGSTGKSKKAGGN